MPDPGRVPAVRRPGPAPAEGPRILGPPHSAGWSPGADGRAVAVDDLGLVLVPGGRGAVGVQDHGPAPLVNNNLVMKEAKQGAVFDAGRAAVGPVPQVVDLAAGRGLVAAAGEPAVLVPQDHRPPDRRRDVSGH